ncbi:radical SAM protein [Candidatus Pelagibacter sp.]|nr:radical SAM protein [Candidatus Pelagibacter sp.]
MKKNIYLFEIEDVIANQAKLPYRTGLIWSYCQEIDQIKINYKLDGWYWFRDEDNTIDNIFKKIDNPSVVAFSCFVWNWNWNIQLAEKIKKKWPKCLIIIGGWQPPISDRSKGFFQKYPYIDFICHGEGEFTFADILIENLKEKPNFKNILGCSIPGRLLNDRKDVEILEVKDGLKITNSKKINEIGLLDTYVTKPRPRIDHLAQMPSPYLNGLFDDLIIECKYELEATIETTRGCPFGCTFCEIGTKYLQKIKTPTVEKVFREIDWLSKNKIVFVYNADSNFGMLNEHLEITEYLISQKKKTGYPEKHRVDWAKIHGDKVIKLAKLFYNAGMDKGITIALQSLNPKTLEAVKRKNMDDGKLSEFLKKYNQADLPSYMEIILGLPEESKDSFIDGVCKVMELGQHNYIGIYPLTALPNTPFGDPEYIKRYNLKIIETYPAFSHVDVSNQNEFEREKMVVGNNEMDVEGYKEAQIYRWMFMFAHYLGYTQYISRFLNIYKNLSYKNFYLDLMNFFINSEKSIFLKNEVNETKKSLEIYMNCKGGLGRVVDDVRKNFAWDFEEATAINIIKNKDIFYNEIKFFLNKYSLDEKLTNELIRYQKDTIIDPNKEYPFVVETNYNFYEVINYSAKLKEESNRYQINGKNYNGDVFEWGKETLWWGRRVAACKAKITNLDQDRLFQEQSSQKVETFDKR